MPQARRPSAGAGLGPVRALLGGYSSPAALSLLGVLALAARHDKATASTETRGLLAPFALVRFQAAEMEVGGEPQTGLLVLGRL